MIAELEHQNNMRAHDHLAIELCRVSNYREKGDLTELRGTFSTRKGAHPGRMRRNGPIPARVFEAILNQAHIGTQGGILSDLVEEEPPKAVFPHILQQ